MKTPHAFAILVASALTSFSARADLVDPGYGHQMDNENAAAFFNDMSLPVDARRAAPLSLPLPAALRNRIAHYLGSKLALQHQLQQQIAARRVGTNSNDTLNLSEPPTLSRSQAS